MGAVVGLGERGLQINAAKTPDAIEVDEEDQGEEAKKLDYEALDRLIDSISRDFSRRWISSRLKALARKSTNAATICDHILAEQTEDNIKASTADSKVKSLL
jgi:hypothetical protein